MALSSGSVTIQITSASGEVTNIGEQTSDTTMVYAETVDLDFGDGSVGKFLKRLILYMAGPQPNIDSKLRIKIYGRNSFQRSPKLILNISLIDAVRRWRPFGFEGTPIGVEYENLDIDYREIPLKIRLPAYKYFRFRLEDEQVNINWAFFGFEIWGDIQGRRM